MKMIALLVVLLVVWLVVGDFDSLTGYHVPTDIPVSAPRTHDAIGYLWGVLFGGTGTLAILRH